MFWQGLFFEKKLLVTIKQFQTSRNQNDLCESHDKKNVDFQ